MKVLHILTWASGGAGIAALRLHSGLKSLGVESRVLALNSDYEDIDIVRLDLKEKIVSKLVNKFKRRIIESDFNSYKKTRPQGLDVFSDDRSCYRISKHRLVVAADIIHLHWISGMVDHTEFFRHLKDKPIVWTLHDMNPFTGGCHYAGDCKRYISCCGACPQLGSVLENDLSRKIFIRKQTSLKDHRLNIVADSRWLRGCAERSSLFRNFEIDNIWYGVPSNIFLKRDRKSSKAMLNLPQDETLVLFGANNLVKRKGFDCLIEAMNIVAKNIGPHKVSLVTFGPKQEIKNTYFDFSKLSVYQLGHFYGNEKMMSFVYSASDLFVIPSLEESFGQTCLESMACGIPAVGFNIGGIPDMIIPYQTGLMAESKNVFDFAEKIKFMIDNPQARERMGINARKLVEQEFTLEIQAKRYMQLYKKILRE